MKDVKWPDLSDFGARLVVSPANQFRMKTAMLLVHDHEKFKHDIEKLNSDKSFEQVLVDAHFFEVQNEENKFAYYYRNSAKSGIDLNDVKKIFPLLSNENNKLTPQNNIYLTQLPFTKNFEKWKSYFSNATEILSEYPEVYISKSKSDLDITEILQKSIVQSNKSYLTQCQSTSIPINRLEDYGYSKIFSKVYLDEETALSNGELLEDLTRTKISPFSVPLNYENNGSILIIEDLRQIPEIFSYDPLSTLNLQENVDLVRFAYEYESTFNQLIGNMRGNDIFRMSLNDFDKYIQNLSEDLSAIDHVFFEPKIPYPTFSPNTKTQGIPSLFKDDSGTWQYSLDGDNNRLTDRIFYESLTLRHDFISQLVKQLPNSKVFDSDLNEAYLQINSSSVIKFNQLYDYQSSLIKQKELENQLSTENVSEILTDLDVDFNAVDKKKITESDILNISIGNVDINKNVKDVLKDLLSLPNDILDDRGNKKVQEFAPSMLEIRQVLDAYVIPKVKAKVEDIEETYSKFLDQKYEQLQIKIKESVKSKSFDSNTIPDISEEINSFNIKISDEYNNAKRILWEAEAIIQGVTTGTSNFLFNKDYFYYKKDDSNDFLKFESEVEIKQHKAELYKYFSIHFNDEIISVHSDKFKDFIANPVAIDMLISCTNPYVIQNISENVSTGYSNKDFLENESSSLRTIDLFTPALVNNEKKFNQYFEVFNKLLSDSKFDALFLRQALEKTSNYNFLRYGVHDSLFQGLLIPLNEDHTTYKRKGDGNSIIEDVFAKTSSYNDGFSIDKLFNRIVELESFKKALGTQYPEFDWEFITSDQGGVNTQELLDNIRKNYREDQKDVKDILLAIERQFYKKENPLFAVNKELKENEIFIQFKPNGQDNDLSLAIISEDEYDFNIHYQLSNIPYKATQQLYENIANNTLESILYLDNGSLEKAKSIATMLLSEDDVSLKEATLEYIGIELSVEDFKYIQNITFEDEKLNINGNSIPNTHFNNIQAYNFLNLIDINKRSIFGKFDIDVSDEFIPVKELISPNLTFLKNIKYFSITTQEENVQFSNESDYFDQQVENAIRVFEDFNNAPLSIPLHNIFIYSMQKGDVQYLRLYDNNNETMPFISYGCALDSNYYKSVGFSDKQAVKTAIDTLYKFGSKNIPSNFMPPAKFTFEKYYDSNLNHFKSKPSSNSLSSQIFTSLPSKLLDNIIESPSIHGTKANFRSNRHTEIYDAFEDLVLDKKTTEATKFLNEISPTYSYVMAHIDNQIAILPKNLISTFGIENFTEIHPFDLVNSKIQKNDLIDLFTTGVDSRTESNISKLKLRITLGKIGNPETESIKPKFYNEQLLINQEFEAKYTNIKKLEEVDAVLMEHVESLKIALQQAYLVQFPGSTPSKHNYTLLNRESLDDFTPQLFLVDRNYEQYLASELLSLSHPKYSYINIQGFSDPQDYKYEIITNLKSKANLGTHFENLAFSNLPSYKIPHRTEYANKKLASLQYHALISNSLSNIYSQASDLKNFINKKNSKLVLGYVPSSDSDYATFKLFKNDESLDGDFKKLCVFPLDSVNSIEDILIIQKKVFNDFNFIENLVPNVSYEPIKDKAQVEIKVEETPVSKGPITYLGDVGKKFGGAHKDRYGEYISLEYISSTSADQTATDYRKPKIIANKEFQLWYSNTNLAIDDKIFVKAMYDYCPPKPLFSKNALLIDSQRALELKAYVAVVSNLRNLMVDTKDELLMAINNNQHLTAEGLGFTELQHRDYIGLYSKGTKFNYKNYFEILNKLNQYYIGPNHNDGMSVQLEKILEKTIDKEFSKVLYTGRIFDSYSKLKVDIEISDAISNMQRTGLYSPVLEPYIFKNAIETGLVKAESDPILVKDPVQTVIENNDNQKVSRQPKVPSYTSNTITHDTGYITDNIQSDVYGLLNYSRKGPNYRGSEDIDSFKLKNTFDISGVEVGNNVSPVAQQLVNAVYDSFNDLKKLMSFSSNEGLLNVGVALASRGIKGAAAHYEISKNVVNLTRDNGAGSLAHEYAHALDAYLGTMEKAEIYKNKSGISHRQLQEYFEEIPNFEIPSARHFLSKMIDSDYSPITEPGRVFEKIYRAMAYQPVQEMQSYAQVANEKAESAIEQYFGILEKCEDEVKNHQSAYLKTDNQTLNKFFDWHENHYSNLIQRQFDKVEEYLKKYESEYKQDDNLSFFKSIQDKVDMIISKINTDINSLSFKSFERHLERMNGYQSPDHHLPITGAEERISKIFTAADVSLLDLSAHLDEYLSELSKVKFYNLVEKYMPEAVKDPHRQMQSFFHKTSDNFPKNISDIRLSNVISRYKEDCLNTDRVENRATPYYATSTEMFARYFETYLYSKIVNQNDISNTFLIDGYPQVKPKGLEFEICNNLMDELVRTCVSEVFDKDLSIDNEMIIKAQKTKDNDSENLSLTI